MSLYLIQHNFDVSKRTARRVKSFSWKHLDSAAEFATQGSKAESEFACSKWNLYWTEHLGAWGDGLITPVQLSRSHAFTYLEAAEAKKQYLELYTKWREDPANFHVNGIYPKNARQTWDEILLTPVWTFWSP
jgi:hypothetical protein